MGSGQCGGRGVLRGCRLLKLWGCRAEFSLCFEGVGRVRVFGLGSGVRGVGFVLGVQRCTRAVEGFYIRFRV